MDKLHILSYLHVSMMATAMFTLGETVGYSLKKCDTSNEVVCNCSSIGLAHLPLEITLQANKTNFLVVDFSGNHIKTFPKNAFNAENNISTLLMDNNKISKIEPKAFKILPYLRTLYMSGNKLDGKRIGESIFYGLNELRTLKLNWNPLRVVKKYTFSFYDVPELGRLELSHCRIHRLEDGAISQLRELVYLDLSWNELETFTSTSLNGLHSLVTLVISHNKLKVLDEMPFFNSLKEVYFDNNQIRQVSLREDMLGTDVLERFFIRSNEIKGLTNESFLWSLDTLEEVHLERNPIHCDCHMKWVVDYEEFKEKNFVIPCYSPRAHTGKNLLTIPGNELYCRIPLFEIVFLSILGLVVLLAFLTSVYLTIKWQIRRYRQIKLSRKYHGANFTAIYKKDQASKAKFISPEYAKLVNEDQEEIEELVEMEIHREGSWHTEVELQDKGNDKDDQRKEEGQEFDV